MTIEITETLAPNGQIEWHEWLAKHHGQKKEIWLVFYKKHTGKTTISYEDAVEEALCFGWIDGIEKRLDDERYALRFTPRAKRSNWSEINVKRYQELVRTGKMTAAGKAAFLKKTSV